MSKDGPENERMANGRTSGRLIVNADDWGRDCTTTDRTRECVRHGSISAVSAMVFMEDSARAAAVARDEAIDTGLHLNLTTPFQAGNAPSKLQDYQETIARYLRRHRLAQILFHPGLTRAFDYVVAAQLEEFTRLYGRAPSRLDGHHHMHLCANVLVQRLLPPDTIVRRHFTFEPGEKSLWNRGYRSLVDRAVARRHRTTDYFFSLPPLEPKSRLERIVSLSRDYVVEVEAHPVNSQEYRFLTESSMAHLLERRGRKSRVDAAGERSRH